MGIAVLRNQSLQVTSTGLPAPFPKFDFVQSSIGRTGVLASTQSMLRSNKRESLAVAVYSQQQINPAITPLKLTESPELGKSLYKGERSH